jgi:hypothetical protein
MINFFAKAEGRVSSIKKEKYMARPLFSALCFFIFPGLRLRHFPVSGKMISAAVTDSVSIYCLYREKVSHIPSLLCYITGQLQLDVTHTAHVARNWLLTLVRQVQSRASSSEIRNGRSGSGNAPFSSANQHSTPTTQSSVRAPRGVRQP